ncbi:MULTISPECIES: STAS domain-containing protein [Streptacidiphilus]|uniref:STAS domain-containing protein n=2 Tax=Streptacidiphilus TaxID=228398 RepID=A0ABV6UKZ0_9ACTN|nr:STAS domain-containing protein [Streptacidiphilus jeojiense]
MTTTPRLALVLLAADSKAEILLRGEIDADGLPELHLAVMQVLTSPGVQRIEVDVALTTFCDSAGISGLLRAHLAAREREVPLHLVRVPAYLARLLEVTGLTTLLRGESR